MSSFYIVYDSCWTIGTLINFYLFSILLTLIFFQMALIICVISELGILNCRHQLQNTKRAGDPTLKTPEIWLKNNLVMTNSSHSAFHPVCCLFPVFELWLRLLIQYQCDPIKTKLGFVFLSSLQTILLTNELTSP